MDTSGVIQLLILLILVLLSGFFSSAETAMTTVNRIKIRSLAEEGNKSALVLEKIIKEYSKMLSTILIGNNIVNISASSLTTTLALKIWGNFAVSIATGLLTVTILLCGEIVPKTWASLNAESISLRYSYIVYGLMKILTPVIYIVDILSNAILKLFHIDPDKKVISITENDIRTYVDVGHEGGNIEPEEREMIYNVFDFSDSVAKDIMIPRIDMTTISIDASYHDLLSVFRDTMYTRIPVFEEDNDNIVGIVNVKDLLLIEDIEHFSVRDCLREAYYTYEFKNTSDLLMEMRENTSTIAFVLNEYGSTVGMVTLEDLLEEIVGEIRDEYDEDEDEFIRTVGDKEYLIEGGMKLDDINDELATDFQSEDYDSIGGYIIEYLDRLPEVGDSVETQDGIQLTVEEVSQNRIEKVRVKLP